MTPSSVVRPYSCMKASTPACLALSARAARTSRRARSAVRRRSSSVKSARSIKRADEPRLVHQIPGQQTRPEGEEPAAPAVLTPQCRDHAMTR